MINIAIDGPSGAGKSTLSKKIAKELGYLYVDTGALYRAVGLYIKEQNIDKFDKRAISHAISNIKVDLKYIDNTQHVYLNGEDVSEKIRIHEISAYASAVSAVDKVRDFLLEQQRRLAKENNVVMDGRDIGTVVLKDANIKIFLTASAEDRAKRRYEELILRGQDVKFDDILNDVIARDKADSEREIAPLKQADDAILVDTTGFEFEKSLAKLLKVIRENL